MSDNTLGTWSFVDSENAWWYVEGQTPKDLLIQYWNDITKVQADFVIEWLKLQDCFVPRLKIFDDSWKALYVYGEDFLDLLAGLDNKNVSKDHLKEELLKIGFEDDTDYKHE